MATKCSVSICVHRRGCGFAALGCLGRMILSLICSLQCTEMPKASSVQENLEHCSENEISSVSAIIFSIRQRLCLKWFLWQIFAKKVTQGMRKKISNSFPLCFTTSFPFYFLLRPSKVPLIASLMKQSWKAGISYHCSLAEAED